MAKVWSEERKLALWLEVELAALEAWAEVQQMVHDEVPWVFLWQQHDLYGVANWIEWTPRADERIWMYEAKLAR